LDGDVLALRRSRLERFLAPYGLSDDDLVAQVDPAFGEPVLVSACGSVLQGFGNARSDIDLDVVVERERISQMPFAAYKEGARVDVQYHAATEVAAQLKTIRESPWPPPEPIDRAAWLRSRRALTTATRLAAGLPLRLAERWKDYDAKLHESWLHETAAAWWRLEAERRRLAARWLFDADPLLGCLRYSDAVLAALEARAAAAGQTYFAAKWIAEKLRALADCEGLALYHEALRLPIDPACRGSYQARSESSLSRLVADRAGALVANLWYADGVRVRRVGSRSLVSRWDMRAVEVRDIDLPAPGAGAPLWSGPSDTLPGPRVLDLFRADMLWLGLSELPP
jgi:hypothetical protein